LGKNPNVFRGHLISMNIPLEQEGGYWVCSSRVKSEKDLMCRIKPHGDDIPKIRGLR